MAELGIKKVRIHQFRRGSQGLCDEKGTILRRVRNSLVHYPVFAGCCSPEIKLRSFNWIWYRKRKWAVRCIEDNCWELTLPSEDRM